MKANDRGNTHVLEAIVIVSIMVSAIAFVVTYDQPVTTHSNARAELAQVAHDALSILYSTPVTDSFFGTDALSAAIGECLNNDCDRLKTHLDGLVPLGGAYALYVSNGYATYPVYVMGEPRGEAVSAAQAFEPAWSSTFVSTATDIVGANDALLTYELPVFNSNVVTPGGSHLIIKMIGSRRDGSDYVMIASSATVARATTDSEAAAANLFFTSDDGTPLAVLNLSGAEGSPRDIKLRLEESQGGTIPSGVEVVVDLPRGWLGYADPAKNPGWTPLSAATDANGSYTGSAIHATLDEPLQSGSMDLVLTLTYQGDVLDYYPIYARLFRGALASATLLLGGESHGGEPTFATPLLSSTVPNPMGRGAWTTWSLSAYVPANESALPAGVSGAVYVKRIEITEQEGNPIFGDVQGIDSMGGAWSSGGDSIVWSGHVNLTYSSLLNLTFQVKASGTAGPTEARAAFVPPVTFDAWTGRVSDRVGWGFHRTAVLPATTQYAGFNTTTSGGELSYKKQHDVSTSAIYRSTPLPGSATYNTSTVGSVEEALYGSYVIAEARSVPVGGEVIINANVQSLLFALAEAGQRAGVTLRFYPPWVGNARIPIFEQPNLDQGLLSSEVTKIVLVDVNDDGYPDPVVGTTNGRVLAYHGLTGQRLQGNSFTAPVTAAAQQASVSPRITSLATTTLYGEPYIVVGTDRNSDGIFVLAKNLTVAWRAVFSAADVLAIDASKDIDLDGAGQPEIVVARSYESGGSKNALVYVFKANARADEGVTYDLQPIPQSPPLAQDPNAFFYTLGVPATIIAQNAQGPFGNTPGLLVPVQTTADPGVTINRDVFPPSPERGALSTPRAGLQAVNSAGDATSTLFGSPASVVLDYDYGGDAIDDVALGGSSGYVVMSNGAALTQPLYSYIIAPSSTIISADTRSSAESYVLTDSGMVIITDDAWITSWGPDTLATGGRAVAAPSFNTFWVVGSSNQIWQSIPGVDPPLPSQAQMPEFKELALVPPIVTGDPTFFVGKLYDFNDISFRDSEGWIVGSTCVGVGCPTVPLIMHTTDAGTSWSAVTAAGYDGVSAASSLTRVKVIAGTPWALGASGTVLRYSTSTGLWSVLVVGDGGTADTLRDIACKPSDPDTCIIVGDAGAAFRITNARSVTPTWDSLKGEDSLPTDQPLYSIGYQTDDRVYIGSHNRVLASFEGAAWTTLPMNYLENDARAINGLGDGAGYVYGGSAANGRIWFLHDYHTQSMTRTLTYDDMIPAGATITGVQLLGTNASLGLQEVMVAVTANGGTDWTSLGPLIVTTDDPTEDPRNAVVPQIPFEEGQRGRDLRFELRMNTSGDKTIVSPHVRSMSFRIYCDLCPPDGYVDVSLTFASDARKDPLYTTADWDTDLAALHQPFVPEYWVRNVSGGILDMQTGFNMNGDAWDEVWVATGDVLAENSPDYTIYAGTNLSQIMRADDRVYMLNGKNGDILATSSVLGGEVRHIRLADANTDGVPEMLYAVTWNELGDTSRLYALDPLTLAIQWSSVLGAETPTDLEVGSLPGPRASIFSSTEMPASDPSSIGHLWAFDPDTHGPLWTAIPDDMGKYEVRTKVKPGWFFGPYVVEVNVEWEESVDVGGVATDLLRSARFYDHFMVTPPDSLSPPTPVYTARLLMWMRDW